VKTFTKGGKGGGERKVVTLRTKKEVKLPCFPKPRLSPKGSEKTAKKQPKETGRKKKGTWCNSGGKAGVAGGYAGRGSKFLSGEQLANGLMGR